MNDFGKEGENYFMGLGSGFVNGTGCFVSQPKMFNLYLLFSYFLKLCRFMRMILPFLVTCFCLIQYNLLFSQTYSSVPSIGTYNSCPSGNSTQSCGTYLGNTIKMQLAQVTSTSFVFKIKKCTGTFGTSGTAYIKDGLGVCGNVLNGSGTSYSVGASEITITIPIPTGFNFGVRNFYGTITVNNSNQDRYWAGSVEITVVCPGQETAANIFTTQFPNAYSSPAGSLGYSCFSSTINEYIAGQSDVDYFAYTTSIPGEMDINLSALPADYELELWTGISTNLTYLGGSFNSGTNSEQFSYIKIDNATQNFFIKVYSKIAGVYSCNPYNLNLSFQPTPTNSQFSASNITCNGFTATWPAVSGAGLYEINYKLASGNYGQFGSLTSSTNSVNITGLAPGTSYQFQVRARCTPINWGAWSPSSTNSFTTLSGANVSNLSLSSGTIIAPDPGIQGQVASFNGFVANNSSCPWTGDLQFLLIPSSGNSVPIQTFTNITIPQGSPYNMNYSTPLPNGVSSPPGSYTVAVQARNGTNAYTNVSGGANANPRPWTIVANSSSLQLNQAISIVPTTVVYQQSASFKAKIKNAGTQTFNGNIVMQLLDVNQGYLTNLHIKNGVTIAANAFDSLEFSTSAIQSQPGTYYIRIQQQIGNGNWINVGQGSYSNPKQFTIATSATSFNLALASQMNFSPNPLTVGTPSTYTVSVTNSGGSTWSGSFFLKVNGVNPSEDLGSHTITSGQTKSITYTFTPNVTHANPNATVQLFYLTQNTPTSVSVPQATFQNPKNFVINNSTSACTVFGDVSPSQTELYDAVKCLCEKGLIQPQGSSNNVSPGANILRADLAKLVYILVHKGNGTSPAENFPAPFDDMQQIYSGTNTLLQNYLKYAKDLSYLEYGDGVSPFDRDQINFRPFDPIERRYALKVLLEALNEAPDNTTPYPCSNYSKDAYGYLKKAIAKGWFAQNGAACNPEQNMTRGDFFIILKRVLNTTNQNCTPYNQSDPVQPGHYFIPGNFTSWNMARNAGYAEGYFPSYSETSFDIPCKGMSMSFTHMYNSKLTELPKQFMPVKPLGEGWSHNYNAYILEVPGWTEGPTTHPARVYAFWPDGGIHMFHKTTLAALSEGVYDVLTAPSSTTYQIKSKNQVKYTFTKYTNSNVVGGAIWMLTEIRDRNSNKIAINYAIANNYPRIDYVIDDASRKLQFNYQNGSNNIFYVADVAGGRQVYFTFDGNNDLKTYKNARNHIATYTYYSDATRKHLLQNITLPEGNIITNVYNTNRKLTSTQKGTQSPTQIAIDYSPNALFASPNNFISSTVTDPLGTVTNHNFNNSGQPNSLSIGSNSMNFTFDPLHKTLPQTSSYNGYQVTYEYDAMGNIKKVTQPGGIVHTYTWTPENDIDSYTNPKGGVTDFIYDTNKNLDKIKDPLNFTTEYTINSQGLLTHIQSPTGITQTMAYYLPAGDLKSVTDALGNKTEMTYDAVGRMKTITNPNNQTTELAYNENDAIKSTTNVLTTGNIITQYIYDKNDLLREVQNARGFSTYLNYTNRDLLENLTFGNDQTSYTYRNDNLLDKITKPNNTVFQMQYDVLGRLENDGHASYTYDSQDNLLTSKVIGQSEQLVLTYDVVNRVKTASYGGKTITYDYDLNSNLTQIIYPGNALTVNYQYDANNRLTNVLVGSTVLTKYFYRNDGLLDSVWYNNGTNEKYRYDAAGRLKYMDSKKSSGVKIAAYDFELDNLGNHTAENKWEHFGVPNFINQVKTSTFNGENEINNLGAENFAFNANGAQTQKGGITYAWNNVEQMTGIPTKGKSFLYDASGLLRSATRNGTTTKYVWDILGIGNLLMETDNSGNALNYYIYGNGLIARRSAAGVYHFYHGDYRGSTVAMTDAGQNISHKYQYDAFGAVLNKVEANANPFQYVGKYGVMYEGDTLSYMRARWYDASIGRFLSEDPVWGTNLYGYTDNQPVNFIDPNGRNKWDWLFNSKYFKTLENLDELKGILDDVDDVIYNPEYSNAYYSKTYFEFALKTVELATKEAIKTKAKDIVIKGSLVLVGVSGGWSIPIGIGVDYLNENGRVNPKLRECNLNNGMIQEVNGWSNNCTVYKKPDIKTSLTFSKSREIDSYGIGSISSTPTLILYQEWCPANW